MLFKKFRKVKDSTTNTIPKEKEKLVFIHIKSELYQIFYEYSICDFSL